MKALLFVIVVIAVAQQAIAQSLSGDYIMLVDPLMNLSFIVLI